MRVDTGIEEGSEVSMYYDPMIAKLITSGSTRDEAIDRMGDALDAYYIRGVSHNISFLNALVSHPRFSEGRLSTNFIAEEYPDGFRSADVATGGSRSWRSSSLRCCTGGSWTGPRSSRASCRATSAGWATTSS